MPMATSPCSKQSRPKAVGSAPSCQSTPPAKVVSGQQPPLQPTTSSRSSPWPRNGLSDSRKSTSTAAIPISAWRSSADFRGQGLGRKLLDECIAWSGDYGAHKIDLEVWPHNTAARRLYERAGFVVEGRRRRHWRRNSGELWDSIEMSLVLDETSAGSPHEADG